MSSVQEEIKFIKKPSRNIKSLKVTSFYEDEMIYEHFDEESGLHIEQLEKYNSAQDFFKETKKNGATLEIISIEVNNKNFDYFTETSTTSKNWHIVFAQIKKEFMKDISKIYSNQSVKDIIYQLEN